MPIKATFAADFSSFNKAVDQAVVHLKDFESNAKNVDKSLARFGDQFSGRKIMQDATLMARAIEDIGGVAKLTERELVDVGAKAEAAIAKMKQMGVTVPDNLKAIATAAEGVGKQTTLAGKAADLAKSSFGQMFSAFTAANLIQNATSALIGFGKAAIDDAAHLVDLSDKTGISTEALQEMEYAAAQSGGTLDNMTDAAFKLGVNIAGGKKSVKGAVEELGLSFDALRQMRPEEQFKTIASALGQMENAQERNRLGVEIFGKSFANIAATVAGGYEQLAAGAPKMADAQIRALEAADQAWENFTSRMTRGIGQTLGNVAILIEELENMPSMGGGFAAALDRAAKRASGAYKGFPFEQPGFQAGGGAATTAAAENYIQQLQDAQAAVAALTTDQRAQLDAGLKVNANQEDLAESVGISTTALRLYTTAQQQAGQAATQATQRAAQNAAKLQERYEAADVAADKMVQGIHDYAAESTSELLRLASATTDDVIPAFAGAAAKMNEADAKAVQQRQAMAAWIATDIDELHRLAAATNDDAIPAVTRLGDTINHLPAPKPGLFAGFGKQIGADLGGSILRALQGGGNVMQSIAGTVGASFTGKLFGADSGLMKAITTKLPGMLSGVAGAILPGIGALAGPAIEGISKLFGKVFKSEGKEVNKQRDEWIRASFGTSDQLRTLASEAGVTDAELRKLFSVSKVKDFEAAQAAVLAKLKGFTDEQAADAARLEAAIQKYGLTLEQLGPKLQKQKLDEQAKELIEDWRVLVDAGVDIAAVNENMAKSVNEFLQNALKTGTEIPRAFKPILERMVEQGTLTDAAGTKITDLESLGLQYSETMTQGFDRIVTKLEELITKITGVGDEMALIPDIERTIDVTVRYHEEGRPDNIPSSSEAAFTSSIEGNGNALPGFQQGTHGRYLDFGEGTPVMLHGKERVVTEDETTVASAQMTAMLGAVSSLQTALVRALRENALQVRDQTQLAIARA